MCVDMRGRGVHTFGKGVHEKGVHRGGSQKGEGFT